MDKLNFRLLLIFPVLYSLFALYFTAVHIPEAVFPPPASDPFVYDIIADDILEQGVLLPGYPAYFFSPYYAYFFALLKYMTPDPAVMFIIIISCQTVLFIVSIFVFCKLINLLFESRKGAVISAVLYGFYPAGIFYSVLPLKDGPAAALIVFFLYLLFTGGKTGSLPKIMGAAFLLGLLITLRGSFLPVLLAAGVYLFYKSDLKTALCFVAVVFLPVAPLTLRNAVVADDFVLTRAVSGIHAYIAANENADVRYMKVDGIRGDAFGHFYDSRKAAEKAVGKKLKASELNSYWKSKALEYVMSTPTGYLKKTGVRMFYLFNSRELPNNYSFGYFRQRYTPFVPYSYIPYGFGAVLVLGVTGFLFVSFPHRKFMLVCFAILSLLTVLTFIAGRYRLPLGIILLVGQSALVCALAEKRVKIKPLTAGVMIFFAVLTFYPVDRFVDEEMAISARRNAQSTRASEFYKNHGAGAFTAEYSKNKKIWASSYRKQFAR